ncbi:putative chromatin remodeling SWIB-Plus-3 family [Rosa chinensis]|uniref:Putative chromatin remodeling SWIB-Plus-3 family n=3 Tax=Rosa chinensis TaxID=74649 RepID=A0A2P6PFF5_ROSCH|nr:putative chromatin remodeling SWIB-Plus-3 family [Rosa chinensis]
MSDSDTSGTGVTEIQKPMRLRKGSKRLEFIGWGSKPLIEFLRSIGKDTTEKISQLDLDKIICNYIRDKELYVTKDRRKALCDQSLQSIFRTKFVFLVRIYGLLGEHLAENITEDSGSEDEEEIKLEDKNNGTTHERKKRRVSSDTTIASDEKKASPRFQKGCFASIIPENMKLVYVKRSLLEKLLKEPDHSESKVLGSFVRVKNNPLDYLQRNTHQLSQVKGIVCTMQSISCDAFCY